jgi:hypothetical protein
MRVNTIISATGLLAASVAAVPQHGHNHLNAHRRLHWRDEPAVESSTGMLRQANIYHYKSLMLISLASIVTVASATGPGYAFNGTGYHMPTLSGTRTSTSTKEVTHTVSLTSTLQLTKDVEAEAICTSLAPVTVTVKPETVTVTVHDETTVAASATTFSKVANKVAKVSTSSKIAGVFAAVQDDEASVPISFYTSTGTKTLRVTASKPTSSASVSSASVVSKASVLVDAQVASVSSSSSVAVVTKATKAKVVSTASSSSSSTSTSTKIKARSTDCVAPPAIKYSKGSEIATPAVGSTKQNPNSVNEPSKQFLDKPATTPAALPSELLTLTANTLLITDSPISNVNGVLNVTGQALSDLSTTPVMSRDGGRGGYLNGEQIFLFCDTGTYAPGTGNAAQSFRSNSVTVDKGRKATTGEAAVFEDPVGQWETALGSQRGFVPMTDAEAAYTAAMGGKARYAIWAGSSIVPYNCSTAVVYASIYYITAGSEDFEYVGNTLLYIAHDKVSGPIATREVKQMFTTNEIAWGSFGGIRSYGANGAGGNDGKIYFLGNNVYKSILVSRVDADSVNEKTAYEYWNGSEWTSSMPDPTNAPGSIMQGSFSSGDIFYSPYHRTYIFIYMNNFIDNTFYYRYLKAPSAVSPPSDATDEDSVEAIVKYEWSEEQTLLKVPAGPTGKYTYAGGMQAGYYGEDDITNGGTKMLLSWTMPTGQGGASEETEYQIPTAEIDWS